MKKRQILLLILLLMIGFAGITTTLIIAGKTKIGFNENFYEEIYFSKSIEDDVDTSEESIRDSGKKIVYQTKELKSVGDKSILEYTILNNSTQYGAHGVVTLNYESVPYIKVTNTLEEFDIEASESLDGVLTVELTRAVDEAKEIPLEVIIEITPIEQDYTNPTTKTTEHTTNTPTITIDPNGGFYNGINEKTILTFNTGEEYSLLEATREGYEFVRWETNIENIIEGNKIVIGNKNIIIKAIWREIPKDYKVRINEDKYESIKEALEHAREGDTLVLLSEHVEDFTNNKNVILNLDNHTLNTQITNNGSLTIINGIIENNNTAIINKGTLTMGTDDDVLDESIKVLSAATGIKQEGTFNMYDGYVLGSIAVEGSVNKCPENYYTYVEHLENDNQKLYLTDSYSKAVAKIESNGVTYYNNLQDAFIVASKNNNTVSAIRSFEAAYELSIPEESNVTFDIASFTVKFGNNLTNNGEVTLTNSGEEGSIIVYLPIINNQTLSLNNITITNEGTSNTIEQNGVLNMTKSILSNKQGYALYIKEDNTELNTDESSSINSEYYGIYNSATTTLRNINITAKSTAINNDTKGALKIESGNINSTGTAITNQGTLTINGGTIKAEKGRGISCNDSSPTINVNGGRIEGFIGIYGDNKSTKITITGGTIIGTYNGIDSATITMSGGEVTGPTGMFNVEGTITGGIVVGIKDYGINNNNPYSIIPGTNLITIGTKDGKGKDGPVIQGKLYGIDEGKIYYYDGIIKGVSGGTSTGYYETEEGMMVEEGTEEIEGETYITNRLVKRENFIRIGEKEYNSFATAINEIETSGTIELLKSTNYNNIEIPSGKEIVLDLKGNSLSLGVNTITNNGILTIKDSSEEKNGSIISENNNTIINQGTLIIENGNISSTGSSTTGIAINIQNSNSTLVINGGTITSTNSDAIYVKARDTTIKVNGGMIKGTTGIYGYGVPELTITGGTIIGTKEYGIYKSKITMTGGEVTGPTALYNVEGTITGGMVIGIKDYGINNDLPYSITLGTSSIIIGTKDGEVKDVPVIQGKLYGVNVRFWGAGESSIKYYDGIIKGVSGGANKDYSDLEEGMMVEEGTEEIEGEIYITNRLVKRENFIRVGDKEYDSFATAINEIETSGTIELIKSTNYNNIEIPSGKEIVLDLKGNRLYLGAGSLTNSGTLTIKDSSDDKNGSITSTGYAITNQTTLTIEGGNITSQNSKGIYLNSSYSTLEINGGTITSSSSYAIYSIGLDTTINVNGGRIEGISGIYGDTPISRLTITGGNIIGTKNCGIDKVARITMTGGEVTGPTGMNSVSGTITGGKVVGTTSYGISGLITIGTKDGDVKEVPVIQGKLYGVNGSNIKYYDGIIKGVSGGARGGYYEIEEGMMVEEGTEEIEGEIYITNRLVTRENFIKVGNKEYDSLKTAVEESSSGDTLLIFNNSIVIEEVTIPNDKEITINLNNKELKINKSIKNNGKLHIIDSNKTGQGSLINLSSNNTIINYKNLEIDNIKIKMENTYSYIYQILLETDSTTTINNINITSGGGISNKGNLTINNSNITTNSYTSLYSIYNTNLLKLTDSTMDSLNNFSGTSEISNSTILKSISQSDSNSIVTITDSNLGDENNSCNIGFGTGKKITIDNSTIYGAVSIGNSMTEALITNNEIPNGNITNSSKKATINNNNVTSDSEFEYIIENNGVLEGDNNTLSLEATYFAVGGIRAGSSSTTILTNTSMNTTSFNDVYGIDASSNAIVNFTSGNININKNKPSTTYGIQTANNAQVNFTSSTLNIENTTTYSGTNYGIYTQGTSTVNLIDSDINVTGTTAYGVYMRDGTVNVGEADTSENRGTINADVSTTKPLIKAIGTTSGIGVKKELGHFNIYDGKIIGSHESMAETPSDIEYNYELIRHVDNDTGYKYAILEFMG